MAVPTQITDLSTTAASNGPAGNESIGTNLDDYLRAGFAFDRQIYNGAAMAAAVSVASAATAAIGAAASPTVIVTGTTTITAFDSMADGIKRDVTFSGALTLTHNATSLILPGGANITTSAGDSATFVSLGSGNWRCIKYVYASAVAGLGVSQTWQDVKASRALSTTYTNSTGKPIAVSVTLSGTVNSSTLFGSMTINGVSNIGASGTITGATAANYSIPVQAIVPPGATYSVTAIQGSISNWLELR